MKCFGCGNDFDTDAVLGDAQESYCGEACRDKYGKTIVVWPRAASPEPEAKPEEKENVR